MAVGLAPPPVERPDGFAAYEAVLSSGSQQRQNTGNIVPVLQGSESAAAAPVAVADLTTALTDYYNTRKALNHLEDELIRLHSDPSHGSGAQEVKLRTKAAVLRRHITDNFDQALRAQSTHLDRAKALILLAPTT